MNHFKRILKEWAMPGEELEAETGNMSKNKVPSKVNLEICTCKGKGKPCNSDECQHVGTTNKKAKAMQDNSRVKVKVNEGQSKRRLEDKIEKACTCDGGCSLDKSDHKKSCPAYKMIKDDDYDYGGDNDNAGYSMEDR